VKEAHVPAREWLLDLQLTRVDERHWSFPFRSLMALFSRLSNKRQVYHGYCRRYSGVIGALDPLAVSPAPPAFVTFPF